jgi:hypothetical protein
MVSLPPLLSSKASFNGIDLSKLNLRFHQNKTDHKGWPLFECKYLFQINEDKLKLIYQFAGMSISMDYLPNAFFACESQS